mmetsp:Transcript_10510/g.19620  ORF Transcript_10510/g.19620 Transcript_10510/m.19620 type:complete len:246 (-) Transcript_10510:86-823(-)
MTSIKEIKKTTVSQVDSLLASVPSLLSTFDSVLSTHFATASPSQLEKAYSLTLSSSPDAINAPLLSALSAYKDLVSQALNNIQLLERYIILHVPKMEDGNNFGVTVQMTVAKLLKDARESLLKKSDAILTYYNARADAVDKLSLEKKTSTTTSSNNKTDSTKQEDKKETTSMVSEEKAVKVVEDKVYPFRLMALVALDVNAYMNAKSGLLDCFNDFLMIVENVDKNKIKLTSPKGSNGGNSIGMF